jgi:sugar phosphate isomerase/epimerase
VATAARELGRAGAIFHSHFRDCPTSEGRSPGTPEQQVPGRGLVDIPGVLRALAGSGYQGPLSLEVIGARQYPLSRAAQVAAENRGYLNRCLQELG